MNSLFENDPAFAVQKQHKAKHNLRDASGRYATEREALASKALRENERLKRDLKKFQRAYLSASSMSSFWHRKYQELKDCLIIK